MMNSPDTAPDPAQQWWGYSRHHGWVVLDRSIEGNTPGLKRPLLFLRCKDQKTYSEERKAWNPPAYVFAPLYLQGLKDGEAELAAETLRRFQERWPEFQAEIRRQLDQGAAQLSLS